MEPTNCAPAECWEPPSLANSVPPPSKGPQVGRTWPLRINSNQKINNRRRMIYHRSIDWTLAPSHEHALSRAAGSRRAREADRRGKLIRRLHCVRAGRRGTPGWCGSLISAVSMSAANHGWHGRAPSRWRTLAVSLDDCPVLPPVPAARVVVNRCEQHRLEGIDPTLRLRHRISLEGRQLGFGDRICVGTLRAGALIVLQSYRDGLSVAVRV